jgi:imidazolonepropionase-like amidohydrolase
LGLMGAIEPGRFADIVAVSGDPLTTSLSWNVCAL